VLAHTHPHDELVTVIEGTWYVGKGERFDAAKLNGYGPGSFIIIPSLQTFLRNNSLLTLQCSRDTHSGYC
jgi:hypothetical protein